MEVFFSYVFMFGIYYIILCEIMVKRFLLCIIVLLFISTCGCINSDKNLLVGKWEIINNENFVYRILEFRSDGKYKVDYNYLYSGQEDLELKYEVIENNVIRLYNDTTSGYAEYEFLDDNTLQLNKKGSSESSIYERIE